MMRTGWIWWNIVVKQRMDSKPLGWAKACSAEAADEGFH